MTCAERQVVAAITSLSGMPRTISFDITFAKSFIPPFMLPT